MPDYPVSEKKRHALVERFASLGLKEEDLEERFMPAGGPGGQHANKTSTGVVLRHLPTGLVVRYARERSQVQNRFMARRLLADKLDHLRHAEKSAEEQRREKIRRQKRRRSRRAQAKILDDKHKQAEKKRRRTVRPGEI